MPNKNNRVARRRPNDRATGEKRRRRNRAQVTVILAAGCLLLLMTGWAVSSGKHPWQGWLGRSGSKLFGSVGRSLRKGDSGEKEEDKNPPVFQGGGRATLGVYNVHRFNAITETTLTINFWLSGQTDCPDGASFQQFMDANYPFFRQQVEGTIRDCERGDLADKKRLGRKMAARINRTLGRRFLKSVQFDRLAIFETVGSYSGEAWRPETAE